MIQTKATFKIKAPKEFKDEFVCRPNRIIEFKYFGGGGYCV